MASPAAWAELLARAAPDFIELKRATLAPIMDKTGLRLGNLPTQREVKLFAEELAAHLPGYGLACEHEHSGAVLLASRRFLDKGGAWRTWIDFERFADLC